MPSEENTDTRMKILEQVDREPEIKQADLAKRLGIGVGTVNWHIKRLANKGFLKVKRIGQWQWKYILTPKGMKEKAKITKDYVKNSMQLYRETREEARDLVEKCKEEGYSKIELEGENDLVDVCKLTCLEQDVEVEESGDEIPVLKVEGRDLRLDLPD